MSKVPEKIGSTYHAYQLIRVNITEQKGNMKQNIDNAKRLGLVYPNVRIPESIAKFIGWVQFNHRKKTNRKKTAGSKDNPYAQQYILYGRFLYIFTWDKSKLITIFYLPEHCTDDAATLALKIKYGRKGKKKKEDIYTRPLNSPIPKKKNRKRKKKHVVVDN